jgi:hypothetical protein
MIAAAPIAQLPYEDNLSARGVLVVAHDHVEDGRDQAAPRAAGESVAAQVETLRSTFIQSSCTATTAGALGFMNSRLGKGGVIARRGVSLDAADAVAGHVGDFVYSFVADPQADAPLDVAQSCHAVGEAGLAIAVYRFFHRRGSESAERARLALPRKHQ